MATYTDINQVPIVPGESNARAVRIEPEEPEGAAPPPEPQP